jgi:hypothetical protein
MFRKRDKMMALQPRWRTILAAAAAVLFTSAISYALRWMVPPVPKEPMQFVFASLHRGWLMSVILILVPQILENAVANAFGLSFTFLLRPFRQANPKVVAVMTLAGQLLLSVSITVGVLLARGFPGLYLWRAMPNFLLVIGAGTLGSAFGLLVAVLVVRRLQRRGTAVS